MTPDEPVSIWIESLRQGDDSAARKIWEHFVLRLQNAARGRINPETRRVYDEEDAAQSAFISLCDGISAGRFPDLHDRDSLWRLLLVITSRKVSHRHRYDQQERRDVRRTEQAGVFLSADESSSDLLEHVLAREPTPAFEAEFTETCANLFDRLADPTLVEIARLRIGGYTVDEVAKELKCSSRTVQRKLEIIRRSWTTDDHN